MDHTYGDDEGISRFGIDVPVKKLCMKTMNVIRLMHALKAKLVQKITGISCLS